MWIIYIQSNAKSMLPFTPHSLKAIEHRNDDETKKLGLLKPLKQVLASLLQLQALI